MIAMTRIPFGSTRRATNCARVATRQRPKIRPFTILPPITFINPEAKELSVECHMPEKTYMGIDARSDHSIGFLG